MDEPIQHFYKITGFDRSQIKKYTLGDKFIGIMLTDGRVGICSTLGEEVDNLIIENDSPPDLENPCHRIILNAYFNAVFNNSRKYEEHSDIFDAVNFGMFSNIVMVGFFESLFEKFSNNKIPVKVFDRIVVNEVIEPLGEMTKSLGRADVVILTGTTIFNKSFIDIVGSTPESCNVFLLGPSNILHNDMFKYRNVKMVCGSVFANFDDSILNKVGEGLSARYFLKPENKVFITCNNSVSL
jgi:uncharacterized protein (DUF4213/DUF364 family)